MAIYMVTYDLNKQGQNYDGLLKAIREYEHCHALKSAFFIKSNFDEVTITKSLMKHIDNNDSLYVLRVSEQWAANRKMTCTQWLQSNNGNF